jgi:hypothetical protein
VVCTDNLYIELADAARASGFLFVSGEREKERNILSLCFFIFFFFFFLTGSGAYPLPPRPGRGGWRSQSLGLLNSGQESSRAAIALPVDEDAAIRFQDQLVTFDLHMRGNPYEQSGGKTGGSWQLRDRAPWAVFHIQFDKHPIEPLRLRHVHRGYSCGRIIDAVQ